MKLELAKQSVVRMVGIHFENREGYEAIMKSVTKASRICAVTHVIQYINNGMTVVEACIEVGMPSSSF
jgi:hypothetical protein